ncbi:RICIN domain-containing protein [Streptacidiphilus sp. EB129]|jgi:hypothetical protein|uniref:RICIN domain-containing protein n=1 Tax=Streptacidiphilus sp. EB129 TaxID=3156262 RepID=UPI003519246D
MPTIPDGQYLIKNPDSGQYIDLAGGSTDPNTPVIAMELTKSPSQQWQVTTLNGVNEFFLKSSAGDVFVNLSMLRIYPPRIAVLPNPIPWSIEPVGDGIFRIHFPYQDGVITVLDGAPGSQLLSLPWSGEPGQIWTFEAS